MSYKVQGIRHCVVIKLNRINIYEGNVGKAITFLQNSLLS